MASSYFHNISTTLLFFLIILSGVVRGSDDPSVDLQALQATVLQQAQAIQALQAQVTALGDLKTRVDHLQAQATAVAFTVRFKADPYPGGNVIADHAILPFDDVVTNIGNGYNANTGIFTAPVAGTYAIYVTAMEPYNQGSLSLSIEKNGASIDHVYAHGTTEREGQGSSEVTFHLNHGDQVWVRKQSGNFRGSSGTVFTGYLLQAD